MIAEYGNLAVGMQERRVFRREFLFLGALAAAGQALPEMHGLPARATPGDYSAAEKAGAVTIAADFVGHSVPTMEAPLKSEDYVACEIAFYGPAKGTISFQDFSLRINEKKQPIPAVQFGLVMKSLSDPEWIPPETEGGGGKSKGGISGGAGGGGQAGGPPPTPPKMPFPLRRAMEQKALKSVLPEGERPLPVAGLVFFPYRGKDQNIEKVELIYEGPAGKATLSLRR